MVSFHIYMVMSVLSVIISFLSFELLPIAIGGAGSTIVVSFLFVAADYPFLGLCIFLSLIPFLVIFIVGYILDLVKKKGKVFLVAAIWDICFSVFAILYKILLGLEGAFLELSVDLLLSILLCWWMIYQYRKIRSKGHSAISEENFSKS